MLVHTNSAGFTLELLWYSTPVYYPGNLLAATCRKLLGFVAVWLARRMGPGKEALWA